jgi:hypothetical protein
MPVIDAVTSMRLKDYFMRGKRWRFRYNDKGRKVNVIVAHHTAEEYLDAYIEEIEKIRIWFSGIFGGAFTIGADL